MAVNTSREEWKIYQNVFDKKPNGLVKEISGDWEIVGNIFQNPELLKKDGEEL